MTEWEGRTAAVRKGQEVEEQQQNSKHGTGMRKKEMWPREEEGKEGRQESWGRACLRFGFVFFWLLPRRREDHTCDFPLCAKPHICSCLRDSRSGSEKPSS